MKTNLLFTLFLIPVFGSLSAQSYTEGADLPGTGTGPAYTVSDPGITISGHLNTPGDGQDRFQIVVPFGCFITSVTYHISDTANISVNGFAQFGQVNQQNIPPRSGSFANGPTGAFPVGQGTYDCMMAVNIAANDHWYMVFNTSCTNGISEFVAANPISVYPNPAAQNIFFEIKNENQTENNGAVIIISDQLGRIISSEKFDENNRVEFYVAELAEGMYFYQVWEDEKIMSTGKFVIQR